MSRQFDGTPAGLPYEFFRKRGVASFANYLSLLDALNRPDQYRRRSDGSLHVCYAGDVIEAEPAQAYPLLIGGVAESLGRVTQEAHMLASSWPELYGGTIQSAAGALADEIYLVEGVTMHPALEANQTLRQLQPNPLASARLAAHIYQLSSHYPAEYVQRLVQLPATMEEMLGGITVAAEFTD